MKLFGNTIAEISNAFKPIHLGKKNQPTKKDKTKSVGVIIISILLIFIATYFISSKENNEIGATIFGAVLGYWLK